MSKSLGEANLNQKKKYDTLDNTYEMFSVGTRVRVICLCQDHCFFSGNQTGTVISNENRYLSIIVQFDEPIIFKDNTQVTQYNFDPDDLIFIDKNSKYSRISRLTT